MSIQNLFKSLTSLATRRRPRRRGALASRLCLVSLEDRWVPSFSPAVAYSVGLDSLALAAGDFNGDDKLDLVAANYADDTISVLLGNGDGTFQSARAFATGDGPHSVTVGDFNLDGNFDLATANDTGVSVLLGDGLGNFAASTSINDGTIPGSVAVADFNGDGTPDLVISSCTFFWDEYDNRYETGYATVLLVNEDGTFAGPRTATFGLGAIGPIAVADFNGDGSQDVAASNQWYRTVDVLLGDGAGNLNGLAHYSTDAPPWEVAAGDLNGDNRTDLVTAIYIGTVNVLLSDGAGFFDSPQNYEAGTYLSSIALGDFTGDGNLDIATAHWANVGVLRGAGDGTFSTPDYFAVGIEPEAIVTGDFNGDGWLDAATADAWTCTVSVLINDQDWSPPAPPPPSIAIGDATVTEGNTGTRAATFAVTLSAASSQPVTVAYATPNDTATAGSDYVVTSGTLTIPAGQTTGTITVLVKGDRLAEPNETFFVNLSNPTNATIADGQGVGTIVDDEPRISISDVTKKEGKKGQTTLFTFTVTLSAAYDQPVTMSFRTTDGSAKASDGDYALKTGTLTFAPGETTKTITIEVKGDSKREANETFYLDLSGNRGNSMLLDGRGVGTIQNDD